MPAAGNFVVHWLRLQHRASRRQQHSSGIAGDQEALQTLFSSWRLCLTRTTGGCWQVKRSSSRSLSRSEERAKFSYTNDRHRLVSPVYRRHPDPAARVQAVGKQQPPWNALPRLFHFFWSSNALFRRLRLQGSSTKAAAPFQQRASPTTAAATIVCESHAGCRRCRRDDRQ